MTASVYQPADLKRKLRSLKQQELKIRFGVNPGYTMNKNVVNSSQQEPSLVWDEFFDLRDGGDSKKAKYPITRLASMGREELREVIREYFFFVYYRFYKENDMVNISSYDPEMLVKLGLPVTADINDIRRKFHELVKLYHPDNGGDQAEFIKLMEKFDQLR